MLTLLHLLSAIALLVWGTHIVRTGILRVYGAQLRRLLSHSMRRTPLAFLAGIGITALVQSSNATALLASAFVAEGLMALAPALAAMLGADVGTAVMARVLTLDLSWLSPLLLLCGVSLFLAQKQNPAGQLGRVAIGLGLIMLALELIVAASEPITHAQGLGQLFAALTGDLLLAAVIGALFAMLTYSSLATVLLTATLAGAGLIDLPLAIGLVIGANIGSGVLAYLNSSLLAAAGRRVALGNLLYKLLGLLVLPLLDPLAAWMQQLPLSLQDQVIGFHLAYNSLRCLLLLPSVTLMARLCTRLLPERATEKSSTAQPRYLDPDALPTPPLALANAVRETLRLGDLAEQMLGHLQDVLQEPRAEAGRELRRLEDDLDHLYGAVKLYLAKLPREALDEAEDRRWAEIIELAVNLRQAGYILAKMQRRAERQSVTRIDLEALAELHAELLANLRLGLNVFLSGDPRSARQLLRQKRRFRALERRLAHAHVDRLHRQVLHSPVTGSAHLELLEDMKRLNSLFCCSAYVVLEAEDQAADRPDEPPGQERLDGELRRLLLDDSANGPASRAAG
ncbi:Na/Pi cotransporter family protein [Azotobacter chroococcum]|uniref:Na/Pi cotransporter family protein n=1 Tax=Azotobacter chroococcum TaxID=353 RepID=A0AA43Z8S1_9GAMM|nr:Na/Pi cotransporter family protein [Azotobacter chroococcum]NHN79049.1 Na/Pi cotransporter family protein [Azotobacter chroococcum]TBW12249.1 Na/Pi cotransporter family protein [Azotobacter chroococcum subsp. isscasi]